MVQGRKTNLGEVKVSLLLETLHVQAQFAYLRVQRGDFYCGRRTPRPPAADGSFTTCGSAAGGGCRAGRAQRRHRRRWLGRHALPSCDGVVRRAGVIRVPETFDPLQELEVVPANEDEGEMG
jgi:hypothetical protein